MRGHTTLLALVVAMTGVLGCVPVTEPTTEIDGTFPSTGEVAPLPFRVSDPAGLVSRVTVVTGVAAPSEGIGDVSGRDDAVMVGWVGGMCDRAVLIVVGGTTDDLSFHVSTQRDFGGCLMAGVDRSLTFEFAGPVDLKSASLEVVD